MYNDSLGYPEEADFDPKLNVADEEYAFGMRDFADLKTTGLARRPAQAAVLGFRSQARNLLGRSMARPAPGPVYRLPR